MRYARPLLLFSATLLALSCDTADTQGVTPGTNDEPDSGECFFCLPDTGMAPDSGSVDASGKPTGKDGGTKPGDGGAGAKNPNAVWHGIFDRSNETGTYALELYDASKAVVCSVSYTIESATTENDCAGCTFAYSFTLGDASDSGDPKCAEGRGQTGQTLAFGYGPSSKGAGMTLFQRGDSGWSEKTSFTTVTGDTWDFFLLE